MNITPLKSGHLTRIKYSIGLLSQLPKYTGTVRWLPYVPNVFYEAERYYNRANLVSPLRGSAILRKSKVGGSI
jgi:hypothetical protein